MKMPSVLRNNSDDTPTIFEQIVGYDYDSEKLNQDIQKVISQDSYQPAFSQLMVPYLEREAQNFKSFFDGSEPFDLTIENLGIICNQKMQPAPAKIKQFLSDHQIEADAEQSFFRKAVNEEYFGSGFIHHYQTAKGKDNLVYLYDMVENPFYTLYNFAHELTHAMQDKNNYQPYGESGKDCKTDYREIHANLTAGSFMMIKALQTKNPDIIDRTKKQLLHLSSRMSNVMKTPKYGVRYFDWKGLNQVLADIPNHYQEMLTGKGEIDWQKLYKYTVQKALEMDYTPAKIQETKTFLSEKVAPLWAREPQNQKFAQQVCSLAGENPIVDDFISGFQYFLSHPVEKNNKIEQFYQQLAKPATRMTVLNAKMYDGIPNIAVYRQLGKLNKNSALACQNGMV